MNTRKEELIALGAKIDDGVYVFDYSDKLFISEYQLTYLTDLEFNDFLEDVKTAFADEQTKLFELAKNATGNVYPIRAAGGLTVDPQLENAIDPTEQQLDDLFGVSASQAFIEVTERDYSLNDFENLTKADYNGSKKDKKTILDAIADYKSAMNNF